MLAVVSGGLAGSTAERAGAAATTTASFTPVADTRFEEQHPNTAYGSQRRIGTDGDPGQHVESALRFSVTGITSTVTHAALRFYVTGGAAYDGPSAYPTGSGWSEASTWTTRPAAAGSAVATLAAGRPTGWTELDVTPLVTGNGTVNVLLKQAGAAGLSFYSRERPAFSPTLLVTTGVQPPPPDTTPPSAPGNLHVTTAAQTSLAIGWDASSDDTGVTGYNVYLGDTKVSTTTTATSYTLTGLTCGTSYTFGVEATDAAGNVSPRSTATASTAACSSPGDTTAPTAPTGLNVTARTGTSISLAWTAASDNVAVTGYDLFRDGNKVASTAQTSYTFGGLTCGTSYTLGVVAYDAAGNRSPTASRSASTSACPTNGPQIKYRFAYSNLPDENLMPQYGYDLIDVNTKDEADATPPGTQAQVWLFDYDNTRCTWEKDDTYIRDVVSSMANDPKVAGFYFSNEPDPFACPNAPQQHKDRNALIHSLAPNKYTLIGIDANWRDHFDRYGSMWVGTADYVNYNPYICYEWDTSTCDFAWLDHVLQTAQSLPQPYFIALQAFREKGEWRWPTAAEETQMLNRLKDPSLTGLRGYLTFSWNWQNDPLLNHPDVLQAIQTFNLSVAGTPAPTDTTAPTAPTGLTATAATQTSVSLSWNASTDNVAVTGYNVYRGTALAGTSPTTTFTASGLSCGTSYTFGVEATDAAGNVSPRTTATASTAACSSPGDTTAPTAPTGLNVTAATGTSISLAWKAASDNVAVTGYDLFRDGNKVASTAQTSYTFGGLTCGTSYTLGVAAYDAAGNRSPTASVVGATAPCSDTAAPSAPTNVMATAADATSVSLSWGASLDNVGVSGYDVYSNGNKVGTTALTVFTVTGLTCGTSYTFGVEAFDAAGNRSGRSSVTAATAACASGGDPVVTAAGDICSTATDCAGTAALIDAVAPTRVLTLGDNAYPDGTSSDYANYYDPNWGRFKAKTSPAPGNHDYHTSGGAGYFAYFGSQAPAEYYSYDVGSWHLISLNGEIDHSPGSAQETWLKNDLAAHPAKCTLAYWHEPRFSSGAEHGSDSSFDPFWQDLYTAGAELVLNGHDHEYERFAPQNPSGQADPNGIREFVAGTGGAGLYTFSSPIANSEVRDATSHGILKLTLHPTSYDWKFLPVAGDSFTDSGTTNCH